MTFNSFVQLYQIYRFIRVYDVCNSYHILRDWKLFNFTPIYFILEALDSK